MKFSAKMKYLLALTVAFFSFSLALYSQPPKFIVDEKDRIELLFFSHDARLLAVEASRHFNIYEVKSGKLKGSLKIRGFANSGIFSKDGKFIILGNNYGEVSIYDTETLLLLKTFPITQWSIYNLAIANDNQTLAIDVGDGTIQIWDIKNDKKLQTLGNKGQRMNFMTFSPDKNLLATVNEEIEENVLKGKLTFWNLDTLNKTFSVRKFSNTPMVFCKVGNQLALTNIFGVQFVNVKNGAEISSLKIPKENLPFTARPNGMGGSFHGKSFISQDCKTLGIHDFKAKTITLLDIKSSKIREIINDSETKESAFLVAFSTDMKFVSSGSTKGIVKLWEVR